MRVLGNRTHRQSLIQLGNVPLVSFPSIKSLRLSKLDRNRFGVSAFHAFKRAPFLAVILRRLDEREKHWQTASGARTPTNGRMSEIIVVGLFHGALPLTPSPPDRAPILIRR